jgi:hypothetical protein
VKGYLLVITSVVLFVAGMVTLYSNSAVAVQDDHKSTSKSSYTISEQTNRGPDSQINREQTNGDGDTQTNSQTNRNPDASNNCDANSQCGKTIGNVMGTLNNIINASIP